MKIEFNNNEYSLQSFLNDLKYQIKILKTDIDFDDRVEHLNYAIYSLFLCFDKVLGDLGFQNISPNIDTTEYSTTVNSKITPDTSNLLLGFYNQSPQKQKFTLGKKYNLLISANHQLLDQPIEIDFAYMADDHSDNGMGVTINGQDEYFEFKKLAETPDLIVKIAKFIKAKVYELKKESIVRNVKRGYKLIRNNSQEIPNTPSSPSTDSTK